MDAREPLVHETWKNKMSPNPMNPYDQCLWAAGKTIHKRWRASPPCLGIASRPPGAARRPKIKDFPLSDDFHRSVAIFGHSINLQNGSSRHQPQAFRQR